MNLRPSGYEPDELPGCSTPRWCLVSRVPVLGRVRDLAIVLRRLAGLPVCRSVLSNIVERVLGLVRISGALPAFGLHERGFSSGIEGLAATYSPAP